MNPAEHLCLVGQILFQRRLTDLAGGNISMRVGEFVYMSPRYSGARYHWDLSPDQILCGRWATDELATHPQFSREGWSHLALYQHFPDVQAVVHAHAFHVMPFSSLSMPIEPVLEATDKFGVIEVIEQAPAHSKLLAEKVLAGFAGKEEIIRKMAAAVIIPRHGMIAAGKDMDLTLDTVERIDTNAWTILARKTLQGG
jgi:L-fuculose-phosphate aldolase